MPVVCHTCRGSKQILGLGNIKKDCPGCYGVGFVEENNVEESITYPESNVVIPPNAADLVFDTMPPKKRKGRKVSRG